MGSGLPTAVVPTIFVGGMQQGVDPKLVQQEPLLIENGYRKRQGVLSKRNGQGRVEGAAPDTLLGRWHDRPFVWGEELRQYSGEDMVDGRLDLVDTVGLMDIGADSIDAGVNDYHYHPDIAEVQSIRVAVSIVKPSGSSNYVTRLAVHNRFSGALVSSNDLVTNSLARNAKLITIGDSIHCFYTSGQNLLYRTVSAVDGSLGSPVTLISGAVHVSRPWFDAAAISATHIAVIYIETTADVGCVIFDATDGTSISVVDTSPVDAVTVGTWQAADGVAVFAWFDAAGSVVSACSRDVALNVIAGLTTLFTTAVGEAVHAITGIASSATEVTVFASTIMELVFGLNDLYRIERNSFDFQTGAAGAPALQFHNAHLLSKPFKDSRNRIFYVALMVGYSVNTAQRLHFIADSTGRIVGKAHIGFAYGTPIVCRTHAGEVQSIGTDRWAFACTKIIGISNQVTGVALARLEIARTGFDQRATETAAAALLPSSVPWQFDGQRVFEQGFLQYPDGPEVTVTAGGSLGDGGSSYTYSYVAVYAHADAQGNRHRSAIGPPATVIIDATQRSTLVNVPTLQLTQRTNVVIELYRTEADGAAYYKIAERLNTKANLFLSFTDTAADTTLEDKEQLYTIGVPPITLENIQPPPHRVQCIYQDRHVVVDREREEYLLRYSKPFVRGQGLEHSDALQIQCNSDGGRITALAVLADKLIVFKRDRIYATQGQGKNNLGQGQGYASPWLVSPAYGAVSAQSVALIPDGLIFQGVDGFCLLDQSLQVRRVGDGVRYYTQEAGLTITSASVVADRGYVVFTTDTGPALVYSYAFAQWSVFTDHASTDAVVAGGVLCRRKTGAAEAWTEDRGGFGDGSARVCMAVETGWISPAGLLTWQRIRRAFVVGQFISSSRLIISVAYDFDPTWYATESRDTDAEIGRYFDLTAYYRAALGGDYANRGPVVQVDLPRQKCSAIRFRIEDAADSVAECYSLTGLVMLLASRPKSQIIKVGRERGSANAGSAGTGAAGTGNAGGIP